MNDEWETPDELFNVLNDEFNFTLDAAANKENAKLSNYLHKDTNFGMASIKQEGFPYSSEGSLSESWFTEAKDGAVWLNPPYSRGNIESFMEKAYKESQNGATVVCLVRMDPSAKWFQKWVDGKADMVRMLARRVRFKGADSAYNFPTCIVIYRPGEYNTTGYYIWDWKEETKQLESNYG